jgi:hypothetical protein
MWVNPKLAIKRRKCGPAVRYTAVQYRVGDLLITSGRVGADGLCFESHTNVRWPGTSQTCGWRGTLPLTGSNVVWNTCNASTIFDCNITPLCRVAYIRLQICNSYKSVQLLRSYKILLELGVRKLKVLIMINICAYIFLFGCTEENYPRIIFCSRNIHKLL